MAAWILETFVYKEGEVPRTEMVYRSVDLDRLKEIGRVWEGESKDNYFRLQYEEDGLPPC